MVDLHPELARSVLENLTLGIVLIDRSERVSWANEHAASLIGLAPEILPGRRMADLPLPYQPPGAESEALRVRADGAVIGITQRYDHPSGPGAVLTLLERGHALAWCLSALASGVPAAVAASGVLTQVGLRQRLEAEISRSRRYANPLSCITVRLVAAPCPERLAQLARTFKGQLRWVDVLGQWQDDTLLVLLPETDEAQALALQEKLAEHHRATNATADLAFGAGTWRRGDTADQLVERARARDGRPLIFCSGGR